MPMIKKEVLNMARTTIQGKRFEFLIGKIDASLKDGYYMEAISLSYALMEERTYRLLDRLGINYMVYNSRTHRTEAVKLAGCLKRLRNAINNHSITVSSHRITAANLTTYLHSMLIASNLISNIDKWRRERNDAIHDLAKGTISYPQLKSTAINGRIYLRVYLSCIMKIKSKLK